MFGSQLHSDFDFILRLLRKRESHHGSGAVLIVDSSIPGWLHVGTRGHWCGRLLALWILEFWLRTSRLVDTTMEQVVTNLQQQFSSQQQAIQQLSTMLENQQASSAERENALQAQLSDMLERWNRDAADVEVRPEVEPEHGAQSIHRVSSILQVGEL